LETLQLNAPATQMEKAPERHTPVEAGDASADNNNAPGTPSPAKILRFARSERIVHWAIAAPFLVSFASAVILVLIYNPDPSRPFRSIFAGLHRGSGIALIVLPMLSTLQCRRDWRLHFYNIKQAWTWVFDDFMWLALMGLAAVSNRVKLPEQGKFNAAEKLNFMVLMTTYPLYVVTGLLMWLTHLAILSWILHFLMDMLATPLLLGHLFMAIFNRSSRPGLEGMFTGFVDRQWAKHHYRRWYREHHEENSEPQHGEECGASVSAIVAAQGSVEPALLTALHSSDKVTPQRKEHPENVPGEVSKKGSGEAGMRIRRVGISAGSMKGMAEQES
jgi:formate dehydrogenase gamma subunit